MALAEVPRLFHRAGAHVTVLGPADAWPLRGSFVDVWVPAYGPAQRVAALLAEQVQRARYDWIVLGDDPLLHRTNRLAHAVGAVVEIKVGCLPLVERQGVEGMRAYALSSGFRYLGWHW